MVVAGAGATSLRGLAERYDRAVSKGRLLDQGARRTPAGTSKPLNYLIIGSDLRAGNPNAGHRADTIMVAHIPPGRDRAYLISVPRDLRVAIPPDPAIGFGGRTDKINAAFEFGHDSNGGTRLLSATLTELLGIQFDGAAIIDFSGFRRVIDVLGGISMCVDTEVRSIHTKYLFTPGCQQMDGARALDYARQRYDLPNGDYDRQRHQQQMLKAIMKRASDTHVTANPVKLDQLIRSVGSSFTVDTNGVPLEEVVFSLRNLRSEGLLGVQLPSHPETIDEISYAVLDPEASGLVHALRQSDLDSWVVANPRWVNRL